MSRSDTSTSFAKGQETAAMPYNSEARHPMPKMKGTLHQCSILGCPSGNSNSPVGLWLFSLPCKDTEAALRTAWLERLHFTADQSHSLRVCFRHFAERDFVRHHQRIVGLKRMAVPLGTDARLSGNNLVARGASSSGSAAQLLQMAEGVGTLQRQGTASAGNPLRGHGVRGNTRVQALYRPLDGKHACGRLDGLLEEVSDAGAFGLNGSAAAVVSSTTSHRVAVAEKGNAALEAASSALSKCVLHASFSDPRKNTYMAPAETIPSAGISLQLQTSNAVLPVSVVDTTKCNAKHRRRGSQTNNLASSGGHHDFGSQQRSLCNPFSTWAGRVGTLDVHTQGSSAANDGVLPNAERMLDENSVGALACSRSHFHEPPKACVETDCSGGSIAQKLDPAVSCARASMTSQTGKESGCYKQGQPRTIAGSGSVEEVVGENVPEGACTAESDDCLDIVEPVVGDDATLFEPSMGTYVVERETISDDDGHGTSAIRFRVSWASSGDAACCKNSRPKPPSSGRPSSTRNGSASSSSGRRRKTS